MDLDFWLGTWQPGCVVCANCQQRGSTSGSGPGQRRFERENERLRRENDRLREELKEREKKLEEAGRKIGDAEKQIADLERQLGLRNGIRRHRRSPRRRTGLPVRSGNAEAAGRRVAGNRAGSRVTRGVTAFPVPAEVVDKVVEILPEHCGHCQGPLQRDGGVRTGKVSRHQVTELPPVKPMVTEYQRPSVCCPGCGKNTRAPLELCRRIKA